jgi:hypothetical protein
MSASAAAHVAPCGKGSSEYARAVRLPGLLATSLCVLFAASAVRAQHAPDPFEGEYRLPAEREVGTTAGQFRIVGAGLLGLGRGARDLGLTGTLELMTFAYLGVRGTLRSSVVTDGAPFVLAARVGPSLHLLPYRRVDVSLFFEGGAALVEPGTRRKTGMPVIAPGLSLEVWLSSWALLRLEGSIDWGIYVEQDAPRGYLRYLGSLGAGVAL